MAKGLQFLHTAGLVHNNLHGGNILISQDEQAKISDYICPLVDSLNEQATPQDKVCMSSESIKNTHLVSKHLDIYSLGVLYLQVSTQSRPMPKHSTELSEVQRWKQQLDQISTNPLLPMILSCFNIALARPTIDRVCIRISAAKESPQSVMSNTLYQIKVCNHDSTYSQLPHNIGTSRTEPDLIKLFLKLCSWKASFFSFHYQHA